MPFGILSVGAVWQNISTLSDKYRRSASFPPQRWENGDRSFFFDATDTSKEYLVEETKQDDCEYVVFPVANFNAYYGSTTFSKKKLPQLPQSVFDREERHGLCRLKVKL